MPQLAWDGLAIGVGYWLAFQMRFFGDVPMRYDEMFNATFLVAIAMSLMVLSALRLYREPWASPLTVRKVMTCAAGVQIGALLLFAYIAVAHPVTSSTVDGQEVLRLPLGVLARDLLITFLLLVGVRWVSTEAARHRRLYS